LVKRVIVAAVVTLAVAACDPTLTFVCSDDFQCNRGGVHGVCIKAEHACANPSANCASGFAYDPSAANHAGECVSPMGGDLSMAADLALTADLSSVADMTIASDMAATVKYDVGYVREYRIGTNAPSFFSDGSWARVVNMGTMTLDLSTGVVTNVTTDDPRFSVQITWTPGNTTVLMPGKSGGALTPTAANLIVGSGLVTEPAQDISQGYMSLNVMNIPVPGTWLATNVEATLSIAGKTATMPIKFTSSGTSNMATPITGNRVSSAP
jgi:hypothetical protein